MIKWDNAFRHYQHYANTHQAAQAAAIRHLLIDSLPASERLALKVISGQPYILTPALARVMKTSRGNARNIADRLAHLGLVERLQRGNGVISWRPAST